MTRTHTKRIRADEVHPGHAVVAPHGDRRRPGVEHVEEIGRVTVRELDPRVRTERVRIFVHSGHEIRLRPDEEIIIVEE